MGEGINPRSFSQQARYRFNRDRRRKYLRRIDGIPTDRQVSLIDSMIRLEWASLVAEAEGGLAGLREAREHRRLKERLTDDFEASLVPQPAPSPRGRSKTGPPQLSLDEHIAMLRQRQEGGTT